MFQLVVLALTRRISKCGPQRARPTSRRTCTTVEQPLGETNRKPQHVSRARRATPMVARHALVPPSTALRANACPSASLGRLQLASSVSLISASPLPRPAVESILHHWRFTFQLVVLALTRRISKCGPQRARPTSRRTCTTVEQPLGETNRKPQHVSRARRATPMVARHALVPPSTALRANACPSASLGRLQLASSVSLISASLLP